MKVFRVCFGILLMMCLCGCHNENSEKKNNVTPAQQTGLPKDQKKEDEQDHSFQNVEKHLVWYLDETSCKNMDSEIFYEFNKKLLERGYDFVVDFESHPSMTKEQYEQYQSELRRRKENNEQVDLIFTGYVGKDCEITSTYKNAVNDGLLLSLEDYLNSEDGSTLKNTFSENEWDMLKVDGEIYGVNNFCSYGYECPVILNQSVFDKYGVSMPQEFSLEKMLSAIDEVMSRAEKPENMLALYMDSVAIAALYGYYDFGNYWLKKQADGTIAFVNPYEDPDVLRAFELLTDFRKKYGSLNDRQKMNAILYDEAELSIASFCQTWSYYYDENGYTGFPSKVFEPITQYYAYPEENTIIGISSWTKYPNEARKLLTLLSTDEELINILAVGIEGRNYVLLKNRVIVSDEKSKKTPCDMIPVNQAFVYPIIAESLNKRERMQKKAAEVFFLPGTLQYEMELEVLPEEEEVNAIFKEAQGLWLGEIDNPTEYAQTICEKLQAAGWDAIQRNKNRRIYPNIYE